jgi:Tol biopolymer transport system component
MSLPPSIAHYRITAKLGEGGMGEVYRATDTKLGRDVAIKVLPEEFARDAGRMTRFAREAQVLAALNHPNVAAIYGVEENALVLELVEGPTLAERIAQGPMPVDEALPIARQIAEAVEYAHGRGVIHRDLKPANIKLTLQGRVKVLDFGLAKLTDRGPDGGTAPTQTMAIAGTPGYFAPEQLQGKPADARSDVFAFGCVLYELLSGRRAFPGNTLAATLASTAMTEPKAIEGVPQELERVLRRCLRKDPKRRIQHMDDVRVTLEDLKEDAKSEAARPAGARLGWITAISLGLALVALAVVHFREKPAELPVVRFTLEAPANTRVRGATPPAVSPDGRQIVFAATNGGKSQLWLRNLDSLTAQPLAGTEGAIYPFWSPDNRSIGFFAAGKLQRMDVSGGPATTLADATQARGGAWSRSGVIVFAPTPYSGLQQVAESGGAARPATRHDAKAPPQRFPSFLPDGKHFLYLFGTGAGDKRTIRIGSLDSAEEDRALPGTADSRALYSQGHLLFVRGATLLARPFDVLRLAFSGEEVRVAEHVLATDNVTNSFVFSASGDVLTYESGEPIPDQLMWLDRAGKRLGTVGEPADSLEWPRISPDGRTAAVTVGGSQPGDFDIWLYDLLRGQRTRFTFGPAPDQAPVWSPDGRTIVFRSNQSGRYDLYRKAADGSRKEDLLYADNLLKTPSSFSPDGAYLAYGVTGDPQTGDDVWILPGPLGEHGALKPYPFMRTEFNEQSPEFSPDGHWIAYRSNESGIYEVYVAPFPGPGGKRQVSTAGGNAPRWRADGKELFYRAADNRQMAADVDARDGVFEVKAVKPLFGPVVGPATYDVSADGQRFLTLVEVGAGADTPLTVVQNWTAGLKK